MFKLESYITPLLLNYVDKYIKNLKPEDSQFSLWGGDAVFCNLDLRLDVLEQELQLPFTFVNGHIHELRIHIPWTKLGSEPVVITINTIECILKLCTDNNDADCDSQKTSHSRKRTANRGLKKPDMVEAPPGYVQSLINRVISNICIICNNVILKYVEDDIVLSLNIKSVELFNANDKWEKAFVDTNMADTVFRKVIYMQDLTVCLDKRDASGKIETYQDPLLYRCSSTWRMYSVYKSPHSKYPALTRIHMYCESLDFSLTDQQLPMFLRLLYLCIALHNKSNLTNQENTKSHEDSSEMRARSTEDEFDDAEMLSQDDSWGSWAWSFVPEVGTLWNSAGSEEEQEEEYNMLKSKKIFQFGIYIGKSSCVLKHTLVSQDSSCCGSFKYIFSPLMIIKMYGCSMEFTSKGKDFVNVQNGVCGVTVSGLEDCVCGYQDFSTNSSEKCNVFLKSGVPPGSGHAYSFLSSSLFDPLAPENCNQERKYCFNVAEHLSTLTEEVMIQRFPAFAFDYLYELEVPEDWIDKISTVTSSFLEDSNWHESSTYRLVFGPFCVDITSSLIHRLQKLLNSAQDYDYPYYAQGRKSSDHSYNINDDILEQMEEFVPLRQYHLTLFKPVLRLSVADHSPYHGFKSDFKKGKKKSFKYSKGIKTSKAFETLFSLEMYADCLDLQANSPLYPNKLVKIVGSLSNPSQFLLHHCYNTNSAKVFGLEISLHKENSNIFPQPTIIQQTCLTFFMKSLVLPENWNVSQDMTLQECTFECSNVLLKFSEIEFLALVSIYQSWTAKFFNPSGLEKFNLALEESKDSPAIISAEVSGVNVSYVQRNDLTFMKLSVSAVCLQFQMAERSSTLFHAPESTVHVHTGIDSKRLEDGDSFDDGKQMFLQILLQVPKDMGSENPVLLILHVSGSTACLEPAFFDWLSSALFTHINLDASDLEYTCSSPADFEDTSTCSSITQEASASYSLSKSHSTILVDAKTVSLHETVETFLFQHCQFLSFLVLEVEIGSLCGIMPQSAWSIMYTERQPVLYSWQQAESCKNLNGTCVVCLPTVKIRNNSSVSNFLQKVEFTLICEPVKTLQSDKRSEDCFPWTLQIDSCSIYAVEKNNSLKYNFLLCPTTASATVALSLKNNQNQLALCIHMDSKSVHLNFSELQAELLVNCLNTVSATVKFAERLKLWITYFQLKIPDVSDCGGLNTELNPLETSFNYKKVSDNSQCKKTSNSEVKSLSLEEVKPSPKLTLWIQLTLSKLSIVVLGKLSPSCDVSNFKVQFDAEEIVSSIDIQDVYSKTKLKLSSLSINCFVKPSEKSTWRPGPYEGKVLFCSNMVSKNMKTKTTNGSLGQHSHMKPENQPFLVATYTQALQSNVKEKLSSNVKQTKIAVEEMKYISEIDLKIKSFGVILWMSLLDVLYQVSLPFLKTFATNPTMVNSAPEKEHLIGIHFCAKNLPLFYIESNIIQIYLPENITLTTDIFEENCSNVQDKNGSDVLLLQLDSVTLTSQVENPLPRIILDSDIYTSALNSKTIALPGAAVEDRQYQMDICGLMFGTISGPNIMCQNDLKKDLISHYPLTMGENPALEWNIGVIPENRTFAKDSVMINPIVSPLSIRVAVAPAIVCEALNKSIESEKLIIAGISSEVSITSEVCLYLSIHQTCIMYSLLKSNLDFVIGILDKVLHHSGNENSSSASVSESHSFYPSRISTPNSSNLQLKFNTSGEARIYNFVPFELLVTAGAVSVMLFYHDDEFQDHNNKTIVVQNLEDHTKCKSLAKASNFDLKQSDKSSSAMDEIKNINNFTSPDDASSLVKLHPFLCLSITQPHSYLLCHPSSQKFESSCFDLQLHGSAADYVVERHHKSCVPMNDDFTNAYLETKPGEPHHKTGIPPAFLTVTCTDIFREPANIRISVERPMKINFRTLIGEAVLTFLQRFQEEFVKINASGGNKTSPNSQEDFSVKMQILTYFASMIFCTSQIVLEFTPLLDNSSEKLTLSAGSLRIETEIETNKGDIKNLDLNMNVSSFIIQISNCEQVWNFLQPLTFSTVLKCHLKPCLQVELCLLGESLLVNFSLYHCLKMKKLVEAILRHIQKNLDNLKQIFHSEDDLNCNNLNLLGNDMKRRTYWNDDLRKGAFQFIQIGESEDCQPKAHEIVFSRSSANEPASMTWRYPEPRALTKIEVSPVPFQSGEDESNKNVITCYLQYWSSTNQEYVNFCDFVLSETEHFSLDLPDLNSDSVAVSNKWRVLLDCGSYIDADGVLEKENPFLSPLALAACMSIDSCFDPNLVPVLQSTASFELAKIIFHSSFGKSGYSPKQFPFEFDDESPLIQEFSVLSFINPSCSYIKRVSKVKGELSSGVTCEVLEYRNLTMLPVISPVDILANVAINFDKENMPVSDIELVLNPCFIRLSQSIVHTLTYTLHSISQELALSPLDTICSEYVLPNYYIICNNLEERIRFGQAGTEENIILSPLKMHAYSWWCHKSKQVLWLSVGSLCWKWSKEFSIDTEGVMTVQLDNNIVAIIKIKQLSNFQKQVIIDGQLTIHSELNYPIQLRCEFPAFASGESKSSNLLFVKSLAPRCSSPAFLLSAEQCKSMRLSITGILDSQLWSHTICIGDHLLLQIPWETSGRFQTVWCQVVQQKVSSTSSSIVVFVSPLFVVRNNLPMPIKIEVSSEDSKEMYDLELIGQGHETNLFIGSHSEDKFQLDIQSKTDLKISTTSLSVSVSDMNQMELGTLDDSENLYDCCHNMQPVLHKLWPYSFLKRPSDTKINNDTLYPCSDRNCDILPAVASSNVSCTVKIERSQRWTGLNTILYDIKPHVILMNRLRTDLFLFDNSGMQWMLPPNSVAIPAQPYERFRLSILENGEFFYSSSFVIDENCNTKTTLVREDFDASYFDFNTVQKIPQNGSVNVLIKISLDNQKVFLFKLHSEVHQNIVVITAFPLVTLTCEVNKELLFSLYCTANNSKSVSLPQNNPAVVISNTTKDCHPLLIWETSSDISSSDTSTTLDYYISVSTPSSEIWSYPVYFHPQLDENNRHAISIPIKSGDKSMATIPLVVTSHRYNGMLFLIINIDLCPLLLLHNRTNVDIFYGQSCLDSEGKTVAKSVFEELQKHAEVPVISPGSSAHYSFPSLQKQFPCVPDKPLLLCFGLKEDTSQTYVWSIPFKINVDKQFVHILGVCDFMVCSERLGHTINLYIDPVNRIEVNANEVRSRIALATNANVNSEKKEYTKSRDHNSKKSNEAKLKNKAHLISMKKTKKPSDSSVVTNISFINMRIIHVSLIICDEFQEINKCIEVLRLNIDNVILHSRPQNDALCRLQDVSLCFEHIQLDNQLNKEGNVVYDFPVVLHRHVDIKNQTESTDQQNIFLPNKVRENSMFVLSAVIELPNEDRKSLVVQSINVEVLPISLLLEDTFYYKVMNLLKTYVPTSFHQHQLQWCDIYVPKDTRYISAILMYPVHFQSFRINVQEISLSLHASLKLYLSLEHSLLRFHPFEKEDIFTSHYEIGRMIVLHYFTGALFRAGWVVGSLDLLGNPAGFARAIGAGMSDFVYLPYRGLLHGPRAFISGLTNGAISLFTQISSGAITCMASLASSISKNMDFLCLDEEHLARQELVRRHLPQGISEGLAQGLSAFGLSVLGAVAGLVDHPLQVLVSPSTPLRTATGIVGGLGKGIVGVFTKPIGGAAELLSQAGFGLLHGAGWLNPPKRQYQPVTLSLQMVSSSVVKYVSKVALCQSLGDVLLSVEATYVNEHGEYEKNILLLTSEALCILSDDEVSLQRTFALTEIKCKKSESDQSTLVIVPSCVSRKQVFLESGDVLDRVAEYVKKNRGEISNSTENSSICQENISESFKSSSSSHIFFLYPKDRNLFITLFNYAKSKALRKGF